VPQFYSRAELLEQRQRWKRDGKTVVFTNGCYDLLHPGHIRLLEQARSPGDVLILALNSDASTRRAKGRARLEPFTSVGVHYRLIKPAGWHRATSVRRWKTRPRTLAAPRNQRARYSSRECHPLKLFA